jgi:hypothetical protein
MRFLAKRADSKILASGITYRENSAANNLKLKNGLIAEQRGFCAYTEKYLTPLESAEVEHFNSAIKYKDDYFNYYAVIRTANLYKQDEKYKNASFFTSLFFQKSGELKARIGFESNIYFELDENDLEAREFIDFLNLNHPKLSEERKNHLSKLRDVFNGYDNDKILAHFMKYPDDLSFITAVEKEFNANFESALVNN